MWRLTGRWMSLGRDSPCRSLADPITSKIQSLLSILLLLSLFLSFLFLSFLFLSLLFSLPLVPRILLHCSVNRNTTHNEAVWLTRSRRRLIMYTSPLSLSSSAPSLPYLACYLPLSLSSSLLSRRYAIDNQTSAGSLEGLIMQVNNLPSLFSSLTLTPSSLFPLLPSLSPLALPLSPHGHTSTPRPVVLYIYIYVLLLFPSALFVPCFFVFSFIFSFSFFSFYLFFSFSFIYTYF